jgi:flagellar assembly factor FliW
MDVPTLVSRRETPMEIQTTRFGVIQVELADAITLPQGLIGFPDQTKYVLVPHGDSTLLAWLQSIEVPSLAFPVVSAHVLVKDYPDVSIEPAVVRAGMGCKIEDLAILAVLSAQSGEPATVNLLAPVIVDSELRVGAQVFLEGSRFSTRELFVLPHALRQGPEAPSSANSPTR